MRKLFAIEPVNVVIMKLVTFPRNFVMLSCRFVVFVPCVVGANAAGQGKKSCKTQQGHLQGS